MRASGARVLAKTTGSRPVLIFPDGSEREIARAGPASVREQVRLVALAAESGAEVLVAEMMSIGAECLAVESRRILRPGTLAVTNVRLDHMDQMGREKAAIARTLGAAFPERADVFIPEEEVAAAFEEAASRTGSKLRRGRPGAGGGGPRRGAPAVRRIRAQSAPGPGRSGSLGVGGATVERGFAEAAPDPGHLRVWRCAAGDPPRPVVCVNLFAANEPESSAAALLEVKAAVPFAGRTVVAILSLREDRGDRTLQWVRAARDGFFREFSSVFLIGPPARAALRKFRGHDGPGGPVFSRAGGRSPKDVMDRALSATPGETIVVGLGNFVGPGDDLVRYWEGIGTAHDR